MIRTFDEVADGDTGEHYIEARGNQVELWEAVSPPGITSIGLWSAEDTTIRIASYRTNRSFALLQLRQLQDHRQQIQCPCRNHRSESRAAET